uniref:peptidylprolyl isomerase n=1 Tax=Candidatus Pelagibacter sp. TaxID=2024849 RepID=UPI003F82CD3B
VKNKVIVDTFWNSLIFEKFSRSVKIDKKEIELNISNRKKQTEYLLSEIVYTTEQNETYEEKTISIVKMIKERGFNETALTYSISDTSKNGGKLGWIKQDILSNEIKKEITNTHIGKYTKPIVIPGGFIILLIEDIRVTNKEIDIEKEIKNIVDKKTNDQLNNFSNIYINKLKKNTQIDEF